MLPEFELVLSLYFTGPSLLQELDGDGRLAIEHVVLVDDVVCVKQVAVRSLKLLVLALGGELLVHVGRLNCGHREDSILLHSIDRHLALFILAGVLSLLLGAAVEVRLEDFVLGQAFFLIIHIELRDNVLFPKV